MKPNTVPTAPFQYTYKIWDTEKTKYVYTCTHRKDVYETHMNFFSEWVYRNVSVFRNSRYYDSDVPLVRSERYYRRYTIYGHFGDEIPFNELHEAYRERNSRWNRRFGGSHNNKKPDVRYKQGNPNKIKRGYHNFGWDDEDLSYESDYITGGIYRKFSTTSERRRNAGDVVDYGPEIVRGRRRVGTLVNPWDDYRNATTRSLNSWKTHSKRRKQWKPKGLTTDGE